jgi:hypothetical protein
MQKENEKLLNKALNDIEDLLWDDEFMNPGIKVNYINRSMASATKIFTHVLLSKMWEYQESKKLPQEQRENCALVIGKVIRQLILDSTGIDLPKMYKDGDE